MVIKKVIKEGDWALFLAPHIASQLRLVALRRMPAEVRVRVVKIRVRMKVRFSASLLCACRGCRVLDPSAAASRRDK